MNNNYRYQLERYRGRGSRYTSPQCGRKQSFTRYIDTYNIYTYIYQCEIYQGEEIFLFFPDSHLNITLFDKCGYHYTPKQYFTDKEWKSKGWLVGQNHRGNNQPTIPKPQPQWKSDGWLVGQNHRENNQPTTPKPQPATIAKY